MTRRMLLRLALATAGAGCGVGAVESASAPEAAPTRSFGAVSGELRLVTRPGPMLDLHPLVVMLEPADTSLPVTRRPTTVRLRSSADQFRPTFAPIGSGDTVIFVNRGRLRHRVFTAGVEAEVAREVPPGAASRPLVLHKYGPVRFFCSLHPDESFLLYVAPAPYFALLNPSGRYRIPALPPGEYRLSIWSPRVTGTVRDFVVLAGRSNREAIWIDPLLLPR